MLKAQADVFPASRYCYILAAAAQVMGQTILLLLYFQPKSAELMQMLRFQN